MLLNRFPSSRQYTQCVKIVFDYPIKVWSCLITHQGTAASFPSFLFDVVQYNSHQGRTTVECKDVGCQWRLAGRKNLLFYICGNSFVWELLLQFPFAVAFAAAVVYPGKCGRHSGLLWQLHIISFVLGLDWRSKWKIENSFHLSKRVETHVSFMNNVHDALFYERNP